MSIRLRTITQAGLFVALAIIFGFWIYSTAVHRAGHAEFPVGDSGMLILLILWWWPPEILLSRGAPFRSVRITSTPSEPETRNELKGRDVVRKCIGWTIASVGAWVLLEWRAEAAAHSAFGDPTEKALISYTAYALAFVAFLFLWIIAFPVFGEFGSDADMTASPPPRSKYRLEAMAVVLGFFVGAYGLWKDLSLIRDPGLSGEQKFNTIQGWLIWVLLALYAGVVVRRFFLPGLYSRFAQDSSRPQS